MSKGGYLIRTLHENGRNVVLLAGDGPSEVLWATSNFLDVRRAQAGEERPRRDSRHVGSLFLMRAFLSLRMRPLPRRRFGASFPGGM